MNKVSTLEELPHRPHILPPEYCWKSLNNISLLMLAGRALLCGPSCFTQHAGAAEESNDLQAISIHWTPARYFHCARKTVGWKL